MAQDQHIILDKELRRDIDAIIQRLKASIGTPPTCPNCGKPDRVTVTSTPVMMDEGRFFCPCNEIGPRCFTPRTSRERSIVVTKLQEAVMWLGMDLKAINEESPGAAENPYPNSKDPSNTVIDKTADGLKL